MRTATVREVTVRQTERQTDIHTDASEFIICPMLYYSNGTDNKSNSTCVAAGGVKAETSGNDRKYRQLRDLHDRYYASL